MNSTIKWIFLTFKLFLVEADIWISYSRVSNDICWLIDRSFDIFILMPWTEILSSWNGRRWKKNPISSTINGWIFSIKVRIDKYLRSASFSSSMFRSLQGKPHGPQKCKISICNAFLWYRVTFDLNIDWFSAVLISTETLSTGRSFNINISCSFSASENWRTVNEISDELFYLQKFLQMYSLLCVLNFSINTLILAKDLSLCIIFCFVSYMGNLGSNFLKSETSNYFGRCSLSI